MNTRRAGLIAVLVLTTAIACVGVASAAGKGYDTELKLSGHFPAFHGKVSSDRTSCVADRKVRLFKRKHGNDKKLGKDLTSDNGRWKVNVGSLRSGAYYAKVSQARHRSARCKPATSNVATVD